MDKGKYKGSINIFAEAYEEYEDYLETLSSDELDEEYIEHLQNLSCEELIEEVINLQLQIEVLDDLWGV